jgi:hypothetical protein
LFNATIGACTGKGAATGTGTGTGSGTGTGVGTARMSPVMSAVFFNVQKVQPLDILPLKWETLVLMPRILPRNFKMNSRIFIG